MATGCPSDLDSTLTAGGPVQIFFSGFGNYFQHAHHVSNDYNDNITLPLNFAYAYGMALLKKGILQKSLCST